MDEQSFRKAWGLDIPIDQPGIDGKPFQIEFSGKWLSGYDICVDCIPAADTDTIISLVKSTGYSIMNNRSSVTTYSVRGDQVSKDEWERSINKFAKYYGTDVLAEP